MTRVTPNPDLGDTHLRLFPRWRCEPAVPALWQIITNSKSEPMIPDQKIFVRTKGEKLNRFSPRLRGDDETGCWIA